MILSGQFYIPQTSILLGIVGKRKYLPAPVGIKLLHRLRVVLHTGDPYFHPLFLGHTAFVNMHHFGLTVENGSYNPVV